MALLNNIGDGIVLVYALVYALVVSIVLAVLSWRRIGFTATGAADGTGRILRMHCRHLRGLHPLQADLIRSPIAPARL